MSLVSFDFLEADSLLVDSELSKDVIHDHTDIIHDNVVVQDSSIKLGLAQHNHIHTNIMHNESKNKKRKLSLNNLSDYDLSIDNDYELRSQRPHYEDYSDDDKSSQDDYESKSTDDDYGRRASSPTSSKHDTNYRSYDSFPFYVQHNIISFIRTLYKCINFDTSVNDCISFAKKFINYVNKEALTNARIAVSRFNKKSKLIIQLNKSLIEDFYKKNPNLVKYKHEIDNFYINKVSSLNELDKWIISVIVVADAHKEVTYSKDTKHHKSKYIYGPSKFRIYAPQIPKKFAVEVKRLKITLNFK